VDQAGAGGTVGGKQGKGKALGHAPPYRVARVLASAARARQGGAMTSDLLTQHRAEGVLTLTLGNGRAHPLSRAMIAALHGALRAAADDSETRVIVVHGPGSIFCAGHDLKEIAAHRADADQGLAYLTDLFEACSALMQDIALSPRPTIAMVEGIATAAGLQLVAACDLAFASETARVCLPGVRNGGFCTTPAVAVSRSLGRKHLMELLLSGEDRGAVWALNAGLFNAVLPPDQLAAHVQGFARTLATRNPGPIGAGKLAVAAHLQSPLDIAYAQATRVMIDSFMDEGRRAAEARQPFAKG